MKNSLVSVVMSAYNAEKTITDSINSILNQTYNNWEFIIINDFSSDRTLEIIKYFSAKEPRIKIINNDNNIGLTKSLNKGISISNGEFIARLDSDDTAEPYRLEKQITFLNSNPDIGLVGSGAYLIDTNGNKTGLMNVISNDYLINKFISHLNPFIHSTITIRKQELQKVGNYRENFRYSQDYDLVLRLNDKCKLANISEPLVCWRVSRNSITMQHHTLQRVYADIAKSLLHCRKKNGNDGYEFVNFDNEIKKMIELNQGRYLCENAIYNILFKQKYKEGIIELFKGICLGGFPHNSIMRGIVHIIAKVE